MMICNQSLWVELFPSSTHLLLQGYVQTFRFLDQNGKIGMLVFYNLYRVQSLRMVYPNPNAHLPYNKCIPSLTHRKIQHLDGQSPYDNSYRPPAFYLLPQQLYALNDKYCTDPLNDKYRIQT